MSRYNRFGGRENTICGSSKIANENRCQLIEVSEAKSPGKHDEKIQRREKWHFDGAFICTRVEALSESSEKNLPRVRAASRGELAPLVAVVQQGPGGLAWGGREKSWQLWGLVVAQVWSWGTGPEWRSRGVGNAGVYSRGYRASTVRGGHSGFVLQFFYPQAA